MGVRGKFWDLLKPYARPEGPDFLRDKRVAVDLSYWIVQHETAIKSYVRKPHLRLTFFRTINLFPKFGAFPVFVVDGTPSPLKSRARIARFFRSSGIDVLALPVPDEGVSVERNRAFLKSVEECVELLELFGMPVLKANGEAEALCAQLNCNGHVDACITADSDAFLFGAKCVIKCFRPNTKEPFECYQMLDIEAGLGLKRKHLIAISLLVGNDNDLNGVQGIGVDTALRFVQTFSEEEILDGLCEIGKGNNHILQGVSRLVKNVRLNPYENPANSKTSHCSFCGHPGSKRAHCKSTCEYCGTSIGEGCKKRPEGFMCNCICCDKVRKEKKQQKHENWQVKVCNKIAMEPNFPNESIIEMYLCSNHGKFTEDNGPCLSWGNPNTDMLVDFLVFHQLWSPAYIRQRMLPMLSTIYLREKALKLELPMLCGQYEFDSIQRVKLRYGQQSFVIKWKKAAHMVSSNVHMNTVEELDKQEEETVENDETMSIDQLEECNVAHSYADDGCWFILTDENKDLVRGAFPGAVDRFLQEKELSESKRRKCSSLRSEGCNGKSEPEKSRAVQLNITEFYRSTKVQFHATGEDDLVNNSENQDSEGSKLKRKVLSSNYPKSVRRRLLFKLILRICRKGSLCKLASGKEQFEVTEGNVLKGVPSPKVVRVKAIIFSHRLSCTSNMINQKVVSVDTRDNSEPGATGISILVVDCDSTCLTIASKMLHTFGYKVMTATRATDALSILQERQHELDLVLTEVHLPDMDKYELLETMGEISCLPIVVLSADNNENAMLGCLFKGAVFYLLKPITMNDVKSLWQFSYMKTPGEIAPIEGSKSFQEGSSENGSIEASECLSFSDAWEQIAQKGKRKEPEDIDKDKRDDSVKSTVPKKPKLIWTNELHDRFLQAIRILGIDSAHPKKILKHMNVPGLKKENISSHLQKYRLSLKREQDAIQKTMLRDYHLSSFNPQRENCQFLKPQFLTTTQQEISSHVQNHKNPDGSMCLASLGCANYPIQDSSNQGYNLISKSGEPVPQNEHNNEFGQMGNDNGEEFLKLSDEENSRFENAADGLEFLGNWSEQQQQFQEPPVSPAPLRLEQEGEDILWAERGTSDLFDSADWSA